MSNMQTKTFLALVGYPIQDIIALLNDNTHTEEEVQTFCAMLGKMLGYSTQRECERIMKGIGE